MTNRKNKGKQFKTSNNEASNKKENNFLKGGWKDMISIILSCVALIVSIFAYHNQSQYAEMEYEYKLEPEIDVTGAMSFEMQRQDDGVDITLNNDNFEIQVLQKNNLRRAYLIHANYKVEKLEMDEIEQTLNNDWENTFQFKEPDLEKNGVKYNYEFLYLEGLDQSSSLYLIYARYGKTENFCVQALSGVEIIELEKLNEDDDKYEGERELAKLYLDIWDMCQNYRHEL